MSWNTECVVETTTGTHTHSGFYAVLVGLQKACGKQDAGLIQQGTSYVSIINTETFSNPLTLGMIMHTFILSFL